MGCSVHVSNHTPVGLVLLIFWRPGYGVFGRGPNFRYSGRVFGRKSKVEKSPIEAVEPVEEAEPQVSKNSGYTAPKGRPTPSRKEREAARRKPIVGGDRQAAKEAQREQRAQDRKLHAHALRTGDEKYEKYLPAQHQGRQRRFVRDYVDARHNVGDYMLYVLGGCLLIGLIFAGTQLSFAPQVYTATVYIMYGYLFLFALDLWFLWRKLKGILVGKFGEAQRGSVSYIFGRVSMIRRLRQPAPRVKYGEYPKF